MKIHYIYAHPQTESFNAELKKIALAALNENNHEVKASDLYNMRFNPIASWDDFKIDTQQTQYFLAQQAAFQQHALSADIQTEIEKIAWADHLIFQFPLWWFSVPAILKGWFDRVLIKGFAYDTGKIFQEGLLKGKTASLVLTTQSPESAYQLDGIHGETIDTFLRPIHHTLRFVGVKPLNPFITYAAFNLEEDRKITIFKEFRSFINSIG